MFGIGTTEFILLLIIILIFLGPKKLPGLARAFGKGLSEFKKASREIKSSIAEIELEKPELQEKPEEEKKASKENELKG